MSIFLLDGMQFHAQHLPRRICCFRKFSTLRADGPLIAEAPVEGTSSLRQGEGTMRPLVLVLLVILLVSVLPTWPYSTGWGYYPSGLGLLVLIVAAVLLLRRA
jgi:hypothetical protein